MNKLTEETVARAVAVLGEREAARVLREAINAAEGGGRKRAKKSRSVKAKGRELVLAIQQWLLESLPDLEPDDVLIQTTSVGGQDIHLSPKAARLFPFAVESKNQEGLAIWQALKQMKINAEDKGRYPALIFKRNESDTFICFPLSVFTEVYLCPSTKPSST